MNWTHNLLACSIVSQSTTLLHAPMAGSRQIRIYGKKHVEVKESWLNTDSRQLEYFGRNMYTLGNSV
jgi:hypothetical protein